MFENALKNILNKFMCCKSTVARYLKYIAVCINMFVKMFVNLKLIHSNFRS